MVTGDVNGSPLDAGSVPMYNGSCQENEKGRKGKHFKYPQSTILFFRWRN